MTLKLNTNIDAMITQASLTISGQKKSTEIQRLGTGFRINTAKDDAAGLAISDGMVSQVRGLTQARRNADDGISLAQTTEGALSGMTALGLVKDAKDADDAVETTAFASANVLQQAGVAVLAQANQQPQQILKLLPE